jgi:hypothetical protein
MPRTNPSTGNPRNPRQPRGTPKTPQPVVPMPDVPVPIAPPPATALDQGNATLQALTGINFSPTLPTTLPDFSKLTQVSDVGSPTHFDAAGWNRVSDAQRVEDARHYRELKNYAANVGDGVRVLNEMAVAALAATDYGKTLIRYATGVEAMSTETVKFRVQQTESAIAAEKLLGKQNDLHHQSQLNAVNLTQDNQLIAFRHQQNQAQQHQYEADLAALATKLDETLRKNDSDRLDVSHKYPQLLN